MVNNICYNCSKELTKDNRTVEHVPAKNLYEGFGNEFKKNRITVPSCVECNNLYSKIDQEIRDAIAVTNGDLKQRKELTGKGVRSIFRHSNWKSRTHIDINGNVTAVDFSYADLCKLHIKNFKALFFRKYGCPVPGNFIIEVFADGDEALIASAQVIHNYIRQDKEWEISGYADIFKFILKDMTTDLEQHIIYESNNLDKLQAVAGLLVYHDDIGTIVVAGKKDYIDSCRPKDK